MLRLELKVPPLVLWALMAVLAFGIARLAPGEGWALAGHKALAAACALVGLAVALAGVIEFRRARTTLSPLAPARASAVVDTGIYKWSRNPMYLGMALALLAVPVWCTSALALLVVPAFCAYLTRFQIRPEERALQAAFGASYTAYQGRVRRWI